MRALQPFLLPVAVCSVATAIAAGPVDESRAIAKVKLLGGEITQQDETIPGSPVTEIRFQVGSRFGDKWLHVLAGFEQLTHLDLSLTATTDAGLERIAEMRNVASLCVAGCPVTEAGRRDLERRRPDLTFVPPRLVYPSWFCEWESKIESLENELQRRDRTEINIAAMRSKIVELQLQAAEVRTRIHALEATAISDMGRAVARRLAQRTSSCVAILQVEQEELRQLPEVRDEAK